MAAAICLSKQAAAHTSGLFQQQEHADCDLRFYASEKG